MSRIGLAIGFFDGLHLGHRKLFEELKRYTSEVYAISFREPIKPQAVLGLLLTNSEKRKLFESIGVKLVLLEFNRVRNLTPREFIGYLYNTFINISYIAVGEDFRFGFNASGDVGTLRELSEEFGFKLIVVPKVKLNGIPISSREIRKALKEGNVELANQMLGYNYFLQGKVIRGKGLARKLGYPTANLELPTGKLVPREGVYVGLTEFGWETRKRVSLCHIGPRPTFNDFRLSIELWIDGWEGELYGENVYVELVSYLREIRKFSRPQELREQIERDIESARELLKGQSKIKL